MGYQRSCSASSSVLASRGVVQGRDGEDAAVDAHVADLGLVGDAAQGDDGPVLELERREWRAASPRVHGRSRTTKPRPMLPERLRLRHAADVAQALGHDAAGGGRNVDADPLALEFLRRHQRRAAAAEGVEHDVVLVAAGLDDALKQGEGFLRRIAETLVGL